MKVNYNMSAMVTNNQLMRTESGLTDVMERLSSGLKLNRSKDNPAGMAISNKMKLQIDGLNQASRNASDGISVLQTADGALDEVTNLLQRMRELSVQAATDTNSLDERQAIQDEINSLRKEIDRVSTDTEFNTKILLDGTLDVRVYAKDVSRVSVSEYVEPGFYNITVTQAATKAVKTADTAQFTDMTAEIGVKGTIKINGSEVAILETDTYEDVYAKLRDGAEIGNAEADISAGALTFTSSKFGSDAEIKLEISSPELAEALGFASTEPEVVMGSDAVIELGTETQATKAMKPADTAQFTDMSAVIGAGGTITINGSDITIDGTETYEEVYEKIREGAELGNAEADILDGALNFTSAQDGSDAEIKIEISDENLAAALGFASTEPEAVTGTDAGIERGSEFASSATVSVDGNRVVISDKSGFEISFVIDDDVTGAIEFEVTEIGSMTLQIGANQYQEMEVRIPRIDVETLYLDTVDVRTVGGADKAIDEFDRALNKVLSVRSAIGAGQNRLEYAVASLDETSENVTAALSRIQDADMAEEMTNFTQMNVLEQAAISVLTQANDLPQQTLQLLQ